MTKPIPAWVADKLIRAGAMTTDRVTRHAKPRTCPSCAAGILTSLHELVVTKIHVDPGPVTAVGEFTALMTGRATYRMHSGQLFERDDWQITGHSADTACVYAAHACGHPLPANDAFKPPAIDRPTSNPPF